MHRLNKLSYFILAPVYITKPFCCTIDHCPTLAYNTQVGGVTLEVSLSTVIENNLTRVLNSLNNAGMYFFGL